MDIKTEKSPSLEQEGIYGCRLKVKVLRRCWPILCSWNFIGMGSVKLN